jgi:hypothetical protein
MTPWTSGASSVGESRRIEFSRPVVHGRRLIMCKIVSWSGFSRWGTAADSFLHCGLDGRGWGLVDGLRRLLRRGRFLPFLAERHHPEPPCAFVTLRDGLPQDFHREDAEVFAPGEGEGHGKPAQAGSKQALVGQKPSSNHQPYLFLVPSPQHFCRREGGKALTNIRRWLWQAAAHARMAARQRAKRAAAPAPGACVL